MRGLAWTEGDELYRIRRRNRNGDLRSLLLQIAVLGIDKCVPWTQLAAMHDPVKEALRECVIAISAKIHGQKERIGGLEREVEYGLQAVAEAERVVEDRRASANVAERDFHAAHAELIELERQLGMAKQAEANGFVARRLFTDHGDMIEHTLNGRGPLTSIELRVAVGADHGVALTTREFSNAVRKLISAKRVSTGAAGPSGRRHVYSATTRADAESSAISKTEETIIRSLSTVSGIPADEIAVLGWGNAHAPEALAHIQDSLDSLVARLVIVKTERDGGKPTYALLLQPAFPNQD